MEFAARSAEEILAELQSWTESPESRVEGTFEYDCFSTNALEFMKVENELAVCYREGFAQTADGDYLTMRAAEHGVIRRPAKKAIGEITVTAGGDGTRNITLPVGSIFATSEGTRFVTTESATFTRTATVPIEAVKAGDIGNVAAGTITVIPLSIPGINSCVNEAATYDGYDEEDDETLRARFLDMVQRPATSGNPTQYCYWALSIVGVGAARCIRTPRGPGTVKVVIVDSNFEAANEELLERVKTYIDEMRPVGILDGEVEVVSAQPLPINVAADVTGTVDVDAFKTGLQTYFDKITKNNLGTWQTSSSGGKISAAVVGALIIMNGGAETYDVDTLQINGDNDDIALEVEQLPTIGEIIFS